ncbi:hypothetical protein F5X99DRAFT_427607 [Biscogniauxia marginata]|nr:hypothetical protein F5X99DRAFT_427607 [Biscogniauxia marginata]
MAWKEARPGYWQRPIGENEAMIKMIGDGGQKFGKDAWSIAVTASFVARVDSKPLPQALRDGWKTLRFHHPSIASTASEDILEYHTPSSLELDQWADESFILVDDDVSPDDIIARLTPRRFTTLYYLRDHATVLLYLSHWRTDGIGAFHLLNSYFQAVIESLQEEPCELPWGEEATRLVPSVEEALKLPQIPSPNIIRATKQYVGTLANNIGALGTPYKSETGIIPKGTRSTLLRFSQELTTELENRCRHLNISLQAAVHAAVTAAAYSLADSTSTQKHHSSTMRHSIRPYLPTPYDGVAGAAGIYTAGYIVKVPATQSWIENAKQYEAEYSKGATPDLLCSRRQYALAMKDILKSMLPPDPPPSGLDISYIPDVQALLKPLYKKATASIEVRDIGIGIDVLSRYLYVFMWIFNGQLEFKLVYNEAFYDEVCVKSILTQVKEHLVSNLIPSHSSWQSII